MKGIKDLNIKGFHLNPTLFSVMGSTYYDSDDCEDDWIEIIPDSLSKKTRIVLIVRCGSTVDAFATDKKISELENLINKYLEGNL